MVLVAETIKRFGYDPGQFKTGSKKTVVAKCDVCGKVRKVQKRYAWRTCGCTRTAPTISPTRRRAVIGESAVHGAVQMPERPCRLCGNMTRKERQLCGVCEEKVIRKTREIESRDGARQLI